MASRLDYMVGDLHDGQLVQLSGSQRILLTDDPEIVWDAHEVLTISSTALALTKVLAENADRVLISLEDAQVRYFVHGPVPTSTTGHLLNAGDIVELNGRAEIDQFRVIRVSVDAVGRCSFGRKVVR